MLMRLLVLICVAATCTLASAEQATAHRKGPDGLEGWLVLNTVETLENQGALPTELVIERNGKVLRHLCGGCAGSIETKDGGPFFWNFIFLPDGKRFAYTGGSLHFNMSCILMDLRTDKRLAHYDCTDPSSKHQPSWVTEVQHAPELR